MESPTQAEIEDKLRGEDLKIWLELWRAEQGPAKPSALKLIASAIPFPTGRSLRVLDLCCGPGDAGRAIHSRFPHAQVDFVDRDPFFVSLCGAVNRRDGIPRRTLARDLSEPDWQKDLASDYDVVVAVNAMHWFSMTAAAELFGVAHRRRETYQPNLVGQMQDDLFPHRAPHPVGQEMHLVHHHIRKTLQRRRISVEHVA